MKRKGMTLIELLAALSLSAMLMAVLLSIVTQQVKTSKLLRESRPLESWKRVLQRQLEEDYVGCRQVLLTPNRLTFEGYTAVQGINGSGTAPTRIDYLITATSDGNMLVRGETNMLSVQTDRTRHEFVCRDAVGFSTSTELGTDVAPGVLNVQLTFSDESKTRPMNLSLVRH